MVRNKKVTRPNTRGGSPLDIDEFLKAYDALGDTLFRHIYFRVYDRELAKDLMQETFTRVWAYLERGNSIANLRAFLYRVANNLVIDESRKKKPLSLEELYQTGFDPKTNSSPDALTSAEAKRIIQLVRRLEPRAKTLIIMRYVDGFGPKEIAEVLGENENVISVRLHRALKRLRNLMDENHDR